MTFYYSLRGWIATITNKYIRPKLGLPRSFTHHEWSLKGAIRKAKKQMDPYSSANNKRLGKDLDRMV